MWLPTWLGSLLFGFGPSWFQPQGHVGESDWKRSSPCPLRLLAGPARRIERSPHYFSLDAHTPTQVNWKLSETFPAPFHEMGVVFQRNHTRQNTVASMKCCFLSSFFFFSPTSTQREYIQDLALDMYEADRELRFLAWENFLTHIFLYLFLFLHQKQFAWFGVIRYADRRILTAI